MAPSVSPLDIFIRFHDQFLHSDEYDEVCLTSLYVDGEKMYRIVEKKDGVRILTPFIVSRKIFEQYDIEEIIGYTWNLTDRFITKKDAMFKFDPMMLRASNRYSKNNIIVRIADDILSSANAMSEGEDEGEEDDDDEDYEDEGEEDDDDDDDDNDE